MFAQNKTLRECLTNLEFLSSRGMAHLPNQQKIFFLHNVRTSCDVITSGLISQRVNCSSAVSGAINSLYEILGSKGGM